MSWFRRNRNSRPLSESVANARAAVDAHLLAVPINVAEHVTNYNGRDQRPGAYRGETIGHGEMRGWLEKLAALKAERETVERAFRLKAAMCGALGIDPSRVTDAQALAAVRIIRAEEDQTDDR